MAFPVTHILAPMILVDLYRRYISKKKFSYNWVFLAGFFGLAPDFDLFIAAALKYSPVAFVNFHRSITHSFLLVAAILIIGLSVYAAFWLYIKHNKKNKHTIKIARGLKYVYFISFIAAFGISTHIVLDFLNGHTRILYPIALSLQPIDIFGGSVDAWATLDGILLIMFLLLQENVWEPLVERFNRILGLK